MTFSMISTFGTYYSTVEQVSSSFFLYTNLVLKIINRNLGYSCYTYLCGHIHGGQF